MVTFRCMDTEVYLEYQEGPDGLNSRIWNDLKNGNVARISRVFYFQIPDLLNPPVPAQDFDNYVYQFQFGSLVDGYVKIPARTLGIKNDLFISQDVTLKRAIFAAERHVSIFGRLSALLEHSAPIVIGGERPEAIPQDVFEELIRKFPNTYELDRYADARVHTVLSEYLNGMKDARGRYETYLNKKKTLLPCTTKLDLSILKRLEIEKYVLIRDTLTDFLTTKQHLSEHEWQSLMAPFLLLLFPKYIKVLVNITIHDFYSHPPKKTNRYIDIGLVDANGNLDVIEVKRPFDDKILRPGLYRGNSIPTSELSGGIMQAEKYLFHLSKWGTEGEKTLTKKY